MPVETLKQDLEKTPIAVFSDPIFFSKYSVRTGTKFRYFGRRGHGTIWTVVGIWNFRSGPYGRVRHDVTQVQYLSDVLVMHNDRGEQKHVRFGYASYSAIWRLHE